MRAFLFMSAKFLSSMNTSASSMRMTVLESAWLDLMDEWIKMYHIPKQFRSQKSFEGTFQVSHCKSLKNE